MSIKFSKINNTNCSFLEDFWWFNISDVSAAPNHTAVSEKWINNSIEQLN